MRKSFKVLATTVALSFMGIAPSVAGYGLASSGAPLNNYNESSVLVGQGYGTYNFLSGQNGTQNQVVGYTRDIYPGGNSIYWKADFQSSAGYCFAPEYTSCTQDFYYHSNVQGLRYNASYYQGSYNQIQAPTTGSSTRAVFRVCEDQRFSPDPCSGGLISPAYNY